MRKLIVLFTLTILFFPSNGQTKDSIVENLIKDLEQIYVQGHITGFSVAIVNQNGILFEEGFGYANKKANKNYTQHTIQNIASISKTFIGVALLKAEELGKLNLDDEVNKYLPFKVVNPHFRNTPITIRHLATHTSSIRDPFIKYNRNSYVIKEQNNEPDKLKRFWFRSSDKMMTYHVFLDNLLNREGKWYRKKNFLKTKPGEIYKYSNLAAGLAALVLENATGVPFNTFTKTYIFQPLEMLHSGWSFEEIDFTNHSTLYSKKEREFAFYRQVNYPGGGLITSSSDLAKYLTELILGYNGNGSVLSTERYKELFKPQLTAKNFKGRNKCAYQNGYNIGIFISYSGKEQIGHTGLDQGVKTSMFFDTKTNIGKILIVNTMLGKKGKKEFVEIWNKLKVY